MTNKIILNLCLQIIQWVDLDLIKGKNILIVDEVDDTRKTLKYLIESFNNYVHKLEYLLLIIKIKKKYMKYQKTYIILVAKM